MWAHYVLWQAPQNPKWNKKDRKEILKWNNHDKKNREEFKSIQYPSEVHEQVALIFEILLALNEISHRLKRNLTIIVCFTISANEFQWHFSNKSMHLIWDM